MAVKRTQGEASIPSGCSTKPAECCDGHLLAFNSEGKCLVRPLSAGSGARKETRQVLGFSVSVDESLGSALKVGFRFLSCYLLAP